MCQEQANDLVKSEADCAGIWKTAFTVRKEAPEWIRLRCARTPYCFIRSFSNCWQADTKPLRLALDSRGPIFVTFSLQAQNAKNGTPTIGLVDHASFQKLHERTCCPGAFLKCGDLSRSPSEVDFALSLSPGEGTLFTALGPDNKTELVDFVYQRTGDKHKRWKAKLNWWKMGDERRKRNHAVECGFFLKNGCLSFFRRAENGAWHSSGVVCHSLPERVVPCMFMYSFMGYGHVWFSGLRLHPPSVCPGCDFHNHGTRGGWMPMP